MPFAFQATVLAQGITNPFLPESLGTSSGTEFNHLLILNVNSDPAATVHLASVLTAAVFQRLITYFFN